VRQEKRFPSGLTHSPVAASRTIGHAQTEPPTNAATIVIPDSHHPGRERRRNSRPLLAHPMTDSALKFVGAHDGEC
jgi:hypothetical protein